MLNHNYTASLIGMEDAIVTNLEKDSRTTVISLTMKRTPHKCPECKTLTDKIHDYRIQSVKDIPAFGTNVILKIRKRRYVCPACNKRFYENIPLLPKYQRTTNRLWAFIINELSQVRSMKDIARQANVSSATVARTLKFLNFHPLSLPEVISIDEFRGNAGGEKFHVQRLVSWAFEQVRKDTQKSFHKDRRRYFKRSRRLMLKNIRDLKPDESEQLSHMLSISKDLAQAYYLMHEFRKVMRSKDKNEAKKALSNWFMHVGVTDRQRLSRFHQCIDTFTNWQEEILNAFDSGLSNGYTEGCNNKIKVIKRNAYGMRNFENFRARILHVIFYALPQHLT